MIDGIELPNARGSFDLGSRINKIDQFRYIKIQPQTIDLSTRLLGINTEFVGFILKSLGLRSFV